MLTNLLYQGQESGTLYANKCEFVDLLSIPMHVVILLCEFCVFITSVHLYSLGHLLCNQTHLTRVPETRLWTRGGPCVPDGFCRVYTDTMHLAAMQADQHLHNADHVQILP